MESQEPTLEFIEQSTQSLISQKFCKGFKDCQLFDNEIGISPFSG